MLKKNDTVSVVITDLSTDGTGIGKYNGFTLFVRAAFPGDNAEVKVVKVLENYGFAIISKLISPSPYRVKSDCEVSEKCGGCAFREIAYEKECAVKEGWVRANMERIGGIFSPVSKIIPSPQTDFYRNKAQFPAGKNTSGKTVFGFYSKHSHNIVPFKDTCLLHPREFSDIVRAVEDYCEKSGISVYDDEKHKGLLRHLFIRKGMASGETAVVLVITQNSIPEKELLIKNILSASPTVVSIVFNINTKKGNEILGEKCVTVYGKDSISDTLCGVKLSISPLAFYQVNRSCAEILYNTAFELSGLKKDDVMLDLYCGTGSIGLCAAAKVKKVIGVEIIPQAVQNAIENAAANGITNAEFICADAKAAAAKFAAEGLGPDVIFVDPPRKGCDAQVIASLAEMAPPKIVMISCNPSTAARDCKLLSAAGYTVKSIVPVDMFPRTAHVETIVLMTQKRVEA